MTNEFGGLQNRANYVPLVDEIVRIAEKLVSKNWSSLQKKLIKKVHFLYSKINHQWLRNGANISKIENLQGAD